MSDTTSTRKIPTGLRLVKRTTAFGVSEDGKVGNMPIEISVHTDNLHFYIPLPDYVAKAINDGGGSAQAESAPLALAEFERLCDQYSRMRLLAGLEPQPMLLVWAFTPAAVARRWNPAQVSDCDYFIGLNYKHVYVVKPDGEDGKVRIFERNGKALGEEISEKQIGSILWEALVPDIREAREKLDALMKSMLTAATLIDTIFTTADPLVALMNIPMVDSSGLPPAPAPEPVVDNPMQGKLPLDDGGDPINPAPAPASEEAKPFIDPDL